MTQILWKIKYVIVALRSRYEFTPRSAWQQAVASWEDSEDGAMSPILRFYEDAYEWRFG